MLEVDLDSNNYSLLIILPDWLDYGLESLITAMKSSYSPQLREMRNSLQPTWVKAIIPKFYLTGHIVLTADLQNVRKYVFTSLDNFIIYACDYIQMGVLDIFEPTRADFSPMTDIRGIYTRHVEQSVNVNIRTHANDHLNRKILLIFKGKLLPLNRIFSFFQVVRRTIRIPWKCQRTTPSCLSSWTTNWTLPF